MIYALVRKEQTIKQVWKWPALWHIFPEFSWHDKEGFRGSVCLFVLGIFFVLLGFGVGFFY